MKHTIRGHIDGLEYGRFLAGWAYDEISNEPCVVTVLTPDGNEIARGRARHERPDLQFLDRGRTDLAFRLLVALPEGVEALHVFVGDVELHNSPFVIGPGLFDGQIVARDGVIFGDVAERIVGGSPPFIHVRDQFGRIVAEGSAIFPSDADPKYAPVGRINLELRPDCFGFDELTLRAFANGVPFATASAAARLKGYLDYAGPELIRGWLLSSDAPNHQFEIDVFFDGKRIGGGLCDLPREDLKEAFPNGWKSGFDVALKVPNGRRDKPVVLSVRLAGTSIELLGGPFLLGERASLVASARSAAARMREEAIFSPAERQAVELAIADLIAKRRHAPPTLHERVEVPLPSLVPARRLNIIIPIYKGIAITRSCIESVLETRDPARDALVLVNDCSPEPGMSEMLRAFQHLENVFLLTNVENQGFVGTVNRGLAYCPAGHAVMLNSDTRVFPGIWDEMEKVLRENLGVGTITALSNNATVYSYPHVTLARAEPLNDISWDELAAEALAQNSGLIVDMPTGHGFCMLVRREVLDRVGLLDTRFGRGYGEENDLCQRAADLGWRNVAACGVLVEHRESVSFQGDKAALLGTNLPKLNALYPEYTPAVMAYEARDDLRIARWPLDARRLRQARETGIRFALVIHNWLGGGTETAIRDIERAYGYDGRQRMTLTFRADGMRELEIADPEILALFAPSEDRQLCDLLDAAGVDLILIHQLLGADQGFLIQLTSWARANPDVRMVYHVHDFYALCPRVTMLNAMDRFCGAADSDTCDRCINIGGVHEASRLELSVADHRAAFATVMQACAEVIAPSHDTVSWMHRAFPDQAIRARPHPQVGMTFSETTRAGNRSQIVLLGAIGPHKGSHQLLQLAMEARLTAPDLRFHVIGFTDIDRSLRDLGNVKISGKYRPEDLDILIARTEARVALFLHEWPETFSYTLSEALSLGLWPLVPELGAPAERVRQYKRGSVLPSLSLDAIVAAMQSFESPPARAKRR